MSATSQLLERCLAGDPGSIEAVFQTYRRPVFRLAYAALLDSEMAAQAMQTGLNSVLGALRPGINEEDFQRLLFQHTLKACQKTRQQFAWRKMLSRAPAPAAAASVDAGDHYPDAVTHRKLGLWKAICKLPETQRVALALRYEFNLPVESVARILRSSPGTVHARLSAARQVLGVTLDEIQAATGRSAQGAGHE